MFKVADNITPSFSTHYIHFFQRHYSRKIFTLKYDLQDYQHDVHV